MIARMLVSIASLLNQEDLPNHGAVDQFYRFNSIFSFVQIERNDDFSFGSYSFMKQSTNL